MMNLQNIEQAISELDIVLGELVKLLEESGWPRPSRRERVPERTTSYDPFKIPLVTTTPEQAPVPADASRLYQRWFSSARAIVAKNQQSRLKEFDALHESALSLFAGSYMTQHDEYSTINNLRQQADILHAVPDHIRYSALDLELQAYATLMDDEISAAKALAKHGFLRPAGALTGVILERHLKNLLRKHDPPIAFRANSTLSILNDLCKDRVYDVPVWRHVQQLTDLRNLCVHEKDREPTKDEVGQLLTGVSGILRTHL
jgi:hypothetical protein